MISGSIRNREAIIEIEVSAGDQPRQQVEAVVDTGYNGYLTLPSQLVTALSLPFAGHRRGTLADGSITRLDVYLATVAWHGQQKDVLDRISRMCSGLSSHETWKQDAAHGTRPCDSH